ncbi:MAG: hypothetical protein R6V73_05465 [Anaerolineales bacterium]|jgi:hypothetical protein
MKLPNHPLSNSHRSRLLAQGSGADEIVRLCPARHVHVDYGNLSLRFTGAEFIAFATMITQATHRLMGIPPELRQEAGLPKLDLFSDN